MLGRSLLTSIGLNARVSCNLKLGALVNGIFLHYIFALWRGFFVFHSIASFIPPLVFFFCSFHLFLQFNLCQRLDFLPVVLLYFLPQILLPLCSCSDFS